MPIRITGLNSGLDTESLVSALVSAYRTKTEKYTKAQTKLSWKQTAWSELNTKINSFYKSLDALRFTSAYKTKKTNVSDATKASITASGSAVNGTQTMEVNETAKAGYLTGANLGGNVKGSTRMSQLGITSDSTISVEVNGKKKEIKVTGNTTLDDFTKSLSDAGLKASFDSSNHRFFISSKDVGKANDFSLTAGDTNGLKALQKLGLSAAGSSADIASYEKYAKYALDANGQSLYLQDKNGNLVKDADGNYVKNKYHEVTPGSGNYESIYEKDANGNFKRGADGNLIEKTGINPADIVDPTYDAAKTKDNITQIRNDIADKKAQNATLNEDVSYAYAYTDVEDMKKDFTSAETGGTQDEWNLLTNLITRSDTNDIYVDQDNAVYSFKKEDDGTYTATKTDKTGAVSTITGITKNGDDYELGGVKMDLTNGTVRLADLEVKAGLGTVKVADDGHKEYNLNGAAIRNFSDHIKAVKEYEKEAATDVHKASVVSQVQGAYSPTSHAGIDSLTSGWKNTINENNAFISKNQLLTTDKGSDDAVANKVGAAQEVLSDPSSYFSGGANKVNATDARITLNGAEFTSSTNNFEINGLSINVLAKTDGEISITTDNDVQGLYDKIKDFLTSYNSLINEMTSLYNADSAKGYEPLTDEEREAMSDTEIEKWEEKIKSSLLRRDDQLGSIMNLMTNSMAKAYNINGKNVSLASFGIATLGIFDSAENQQNAYHIYGDEDDAATASKDDKLMAMLKSDPDSVVEFMKKLTDGLYKAIDKKMGSSQLSSKYTVYNDKEMAKEYSDYTDTIAKWEEKLTAQEDYYYKKFSAMETALAKLQAQQSQLSGLLGM